MDKSDEGRSDKEEKDTHVQVVESGIADQPQCPQISENQMEGQRAEGTVEETRKEPSVGLTGSSNESEKSLPPKAIQHEESMPEELSESPEHKHEIHLGECQKEAGLQAPAQMPDSLVTEDHCMPSHPLVEIGHPPVEDISNQAVSSAMEQDVSESDSQGETELESEQVEKPEDKELAIQHAKEVMELVLEEAVTFDSIYDSLATEEQCMPSHHKPLVEIGHPPVQDFSDQAVSSAMEQDVSESDSQGETELESEQAEKPEDKELAIQHAKEVMELVLEEAVTFDAKQERMEEATEL